MEYVLGKGMRLLGIGIVAGIGLVMSFAVMADREAANTYYETAVVSFGESKYDEAIIQLKNALQQDGSLLSARILLGRTYMKNGDATAAEKELREAERLGADRSLTGELIAEAYLKQFKYQALLDEILLTEYPPSITDELLVYRGHAYLELLRFDEAVMTFKQAQTYATQSPDPLAGLALLRLRSGDLDGAEDYISKALELAPGDVNALNIRASILHARGFAENAIKVYSEVIVKEESHMEARLARAGAYIDLQKYELAEQDLAYVQENFAAEPRAIYMQSLIYARRKEPARVDEALTKTAAIIESLDEGVLSRSSQLLMLAGLTYYRLENYQQAQRYLQKLRSRAPANYEATRLLATVLQAQGDDDSVIALLQPLMGSGPPDYKLMSILGSAYMRKGKFGLATPLLEHAVKLSGNDPQSLMQLALLYYAKGDQGQAVNELSGVVEQYGGFTDARTTLAVLYIKQNRGEDAIKVLMPLLEERPDSISFNNLLGSAQVINQDYDAARATYEKIEALAPDHLLIQVNIARLDTIVGRYDDARKRLNVLLAGKDAPVVKIMLELARTEAAAGDVQEAIRWAEKARAEDRNALEIRQYLVDLYQRASQPKNALAVAKESRQIAPEDLEVLSMLANSHIMLSDYRSAGGVLREMTKLAGFDYHWLYRIARQQYIIKSYKEAEWTLQKVAVEAPDFVPANVALIEVLTGLGKLDEAEEKLLALRDRVKDLTDAERLLGDIYFRRGNAPQAIQHFQNALRQAPTEAVAIKLFQAHAFAGQWSQAIQVIQDWLSAHPEDWQAKMALAEGRMQQKQYSQAARAYEEVLERLPLNSQALGNLAFIYLKLGNDKALDLAEQAYKLAPRDANINDTLGWILVKNGAADKGLPYLREAHSRASSNPEIRYHIAEALAALGRFDEALAELDVALQARFFDGRDAAQALKKRLE